MGLFGKNKKDKKDKKEKKAKKSKKDSVFPGADETPSVDYLNDEVVSDGSESESQLPADGSIQIAYDAEGNGYYVSYDAETNQYYDPYSGDAYDVSGFYDAEGNPFDFQAGLLAAQSQGEQASEGESVADLESALTGGFVGEDDEPAQEVVEEAAPTEEFEPEVAAEEVAAPTEEFESEVAAEEEPAPTEEFEHEVAAEEVAAPTEEYVPEVVAEEEHAPTEEFESEVVAEEPAPTVEFSAEYEETPTEEFNARAEEIIDYEAAAPTEEFVAEEPVAPVEEKVQEHVVEHKQVPQQEAPVVQDTTSIDEVPEIGVDSVVQEVIVFQQAEETKQAEVAKKPEPVVPGSSHVNNGFEFKPVANKVVEATLVTNEVAPAINITTQEIAASPINMDIHESIIVPAEPAPVINITTQEVAASPINMDIHESIIAPAEPAPVINITTQEIPQAPIEIVKISEPSVKKPIEHSVVVDSISSLDGFLPSKAIEVVNKAYEEEIIKVSTSLQPAAKPTGSSAVYSNSAYAKDVNILSGDQVLAKMNSSDEANQMLMYAPTVEFDRSLCENESRLSNSSIGLERDSEDNMSNNKPMHEMKQDELMSDVMDMNLATIKIGGTQERASKPQECNIASNNCNNGSSGLIAEIVSGKPGSQLLIKDLFKSDNYEKAISTSLTTIHEFLNKSREETVEIYKRLSTELRREIDVTKDTIEKLKVEYKENERQIYRQRTELLRGISMMNAGSSNQQCSYNHAGRQLSGRDIENLQNVQKYNREISNSIREHEERLEVLRKNLNSLRDLYEKRIIRVSSDISRIQRLVGSMSINKRNYQLLENSFNTFRRDHNDYQFAANNFDPISFDGLMDDTPGLIPNSSFGSHYRPYFDDFAYQYPSSRFSEYALNDDILRPLNRSSGITNWIDDEFESLSPDRTRSFDSLFGSDYSTRSYDIDNMSLTNELDNYFKN